MTELSPEAQALIQAADLGGPSPERRARLERRLAAAALATAAGAGVSAISTAASAKTALGATAGKSLFAGMGASIAASLAAGAVIGGITVASVRGATGNVVPAPVSVVTSSQRDTPHAGLKARNDGAHAAREPTPPRVEARQPAPAESKAERKPQLEEPPATEPAVEAAAEVPRASNLPDIDAEASLIAAARRELAAGRPERALEQLSEHERGFRAGMLSEERRALRVVALCNLGRQDEAQRDAEAFLREAPRSPLVPRIRKSCAFAGAKQEKAGDP